MTAGSRLMGARRDPRVVAATCVFLALLFVVPVASSTARPPLGPNGTTGVVQPAVTPTSAPANAHAPTTPAVVHPIPAAGPVTSGRGTFFVNHPLPQPRVGNQSCPFFTCVNVTNEPSLNLTSKGLLAVAYTALTNESPCWNGTLGPFIQSAIGFSTSKDLGATWSPPVYLGNPVCAVAGNYTSAWEPSLTSLANGTLALAYVEYNVTPFTTIPSVDCYSLSNDRLVVQESYDNGTTWTTPTVLNVSTNPSLSPPCPGFPAERPWITAFGKTLYVTWMNLSDTVLSSQVHLIVSKTGGATWLPQIDLRTFSSDSNVVAENPSVLVDPAGELFVTYATNHSLVSLCFQSNCQITEALDVVVARSVNNGTTFAYSVAASQAPFVSWNSYDAPVIPFNDPSPQLAYGAGAHQLYLIYSAGRIGSFCDVYGSCFPGFQPDVYFTNSSDHGVSWSSSRLVDPLLMNPNGGARSVVYNPSVAVDAAGTVHVELTIANGSACAPMIGGAPACGVVAQLYTNSTDLGRTFAPPVMVEGNFTPYANYYTRAQWDGEYATMVAAGRHVWLAWVHVVCPTWNVSTFGCTYGEANGYAQVTVSEMFTGTGIALTFQEQGLVTGTPWSVSVLGNDRAGTAPGSLVISGVPPGENLSWDVASISGGYGIRYFANASVVPPMSFTSTQVIYENYTEQVLVNVTSLPFIPNQGAFGNYCGALYWDNAFCSMINYNLTPLPGANWVTPGTSFTLAVTNVSQFCAVLGACYYTELNLSFESWTGNGAGSTNTSSNVTTIIARGPINETANFDLVGWCAVDSYPRFGYDVCYAQNSTIAFHEAGLPAGQSWTVTVVGAGNVTTVSSNSSWIYISGTATSRVANYFVWSIPTGAGSYWVGTGNPSSPVELPIDAIVMVNFVRELPSATQFPLFASESGLPPNTSWSLSVGGLGLGIAGAAASFSLAGGSYALNSSPVFYPNGTARFANLVNVTPLVLNATSQQVSTPTTVAIDGPTLAQFLFTPANYLTATAGVGGTITNQSQWVQLGRSVRLNETPNPGFAFVGWSGFGPGAINSSRPGITVNPSGPVSEFASFVALPSPTWIVTVQETGLPSTLAYSVGLGTSAYTGNSTFSVAGLATGNYVLHLGYVYLNSSNLTRFLPSVSSTSFARAPNGALEIGTNGFVNLTFSTQYLLTVGSTGSGSILPAPGAYWEGAGAVIALTATPDPHYRFAGWNGTGMGAVNTVVRGISITLGSPVYETAQFLWAPAVPPATFELTVQESGLPSQSSWIASVGGTGVHGTGTGLTITGLNGSYTVAIPPVYVGTGTRYVANVTSITAELAVAVVQNGSISVNFTQQFYLAVVDGIGGTATPGASAWVNAGSSVTLDAMPNATSLFVGWVGLGTGSYSGGLASQPITVLGPITETATFAPNYPVKTTGSSTSGAPLALGLLIALAVVGLVIGFVLFRRRPPREEIKAGEPVEAESWDEGEPS
jgi:Divergent InlB B-repeat domain